MHKMFPSLRTSPDRRHVILLLAVLVAGYLYVWHAGGTTLLDFEAYRGAAARLQSGESLYREPFDVTVEHGQVFHIHYLYPPFLAALLAPWLTTGPLLPYLWCAVGFMALVMSAWLLARLAPPTVPLGQRAAFPVLLFLLLCFEPVYWGAREGQVDAILLLLLCGWVTALQHRNDLGAGFLLGLAIWIKMSPALLLVGALRFRQWRVFVGVLLASLSAILLILALPHGGSALGDFLTWLPELTAGNLLAHYTYNFAVDRALIGVLGVVPTAGLLAGVKLAIASSILTLLAIFPSERGVDLGYTATAIACMILVSPVFWFHHLAWAFVAITFLVCSAGRDERRLFWVGLLFLLMSQSNTMYGALVKSLPVAQDLGRLLPGILVVWCIVFVAREQRRLASS